MLLRNRPRAMNKPTLISDHHGSPQQPPKNPTNHNFSRAIPSLFCSPKFRDFTMKCLSKNHEVLQSPTSILDTRTTPPSPFGNNPFSHNENRTTMDSEKNRSIIDSKGIGLALVVGSLKDEQIDENFSGNNVLFGTQLRVKIPSCDGGANFGAKTKDSKDYYLGLHGATMGDSSSSLGVVNLSEMELCEEYTCVISHHGPNPRTTHIFDNCIVQSYLCTSSSSSSSSSVDFLSFCYTCKKHLEHTKDIFIYRGDKAFCSEECRHQEMVLDEAENSEFF